MEPHLIQGSEIWKNFRRSKLGGSDAPVIALKSPWKTPYQLWLEKLNFWEQPDNGAMARGREMESVAREAFMQSTGIMIAPKVVISKEHPFLMASLDGMDMDEETIVEIKCVNANDHDLALHVKVPEKYEDQLLHQCIVTGLKKCIYFSYTPASFAIVEFYYDEDKARDLIQKETEFFECVKNLEPPKLTNKDYVECQDQSLRDDILEIRRLQLIQKEAKSQIESIKERIEARPGLCNSRVGDSTLCRIVKRGNIQYQKIDILKDIDLEPYRAKPSTYWRIS